MVNFLAADANQRQSCRPSLNAEKKADLRSSHWSLGLKAPLKDSSKSRMRPTTAQTYVTSGMVNFRWI